VPPSGPQDVHTPLESGPRWSWAALMRRTASVIALSIAPMAPAIPHIVATVPCRADVSDWRKRYSCAQGAATKHYRECGRRDTGTRSKLRPMPADSNWGRCAMRRPGDASECPMVADPVTGRLRRVVTSSLWIPGWVGLGVLMRVVLVFNGGGHFAFADERDYDSIATALLAGDGFSLHGQPSAFRPPGQSVFLAAIYALSGHHPLVAELVQAVLVAVVPFAVLALGRRATARPLVPEIAAALAAVHPGLAYASATVYPVSLTAAALAVGIWLAAEVSRRRGIGLATLAGLALGTAGAATPYFVPLPALIALVVYRRVGALAAIMLASMGLLPAAAWMTRNAVALGAPTLGTNGGYNLALGANDRATFRSGNWIEPDPIDEAAARTELARDAAWARAGRRWIAEHPARWAGLALGRALAVLDSVGKPRTSGLHENRWAKLVGWAMLPWIVFGVAGLWIDRRALEARIVALTFLLVLASSSATIVKPRFRFPVDPLLAIFAVDFVFRVSFALRARWARTPMP
jgi:hypothetical protein